MSPATTQQHYGDTRGFLWWEQAHPRINHMKSPTKERARDRALTNDEIRWFWQACDEIGWPFGPIFKLLLLTAQRRDEVGGMKWTEIMQNSSQSVLLTEEPSMGATTLGSDYPSP